MPVQAQSIIDRVRTQLIDTGSAQRWTDAELLKWLSDGQRTLVAAMPEASSTISNASLVAGVRQTIPADGHVALRINRNANGRSCNAVPRDLLNIQYPTWTTDAASATVKHFFIDEVDKRYFYVYPPNTGTGTVELVYSVMPADLASTTSLLTVRDIYQTPLFDYVMARAHQKDSDFAAGQKTAEMYMQSFVAFLASNRTEPNRSA